MISSKPALRLWPISAIALTGIMPVWAVETSAERTVKQPRPHSAPSQARIPSKKAASQMIGVDHMRAVTGIAQRMEAMMDLVKGASTVVRPEATLDREGRAGIFIICSRPFFPPPDTSGLSSQKAWVMMAVFAAVKHTNDSPFPVDYLGFTDLSAMEDDSWYFKLEMSTAILVQRQLQANTISLEQGYDQITSAWQRVAPKREPGFTP